MDSSLNELYQHTVNAYRNIDLKEYKQAEDVEDQIDALTEKMADNHLIRLKSGSCTPNAGAQYLKLSSDSERIADHFINVAKTIKKLA